MDDVKDLRPVIKDILAVFEKHGFTNPAVAVAFTADQDHHQVHWMTNVSRGDGIRLLVETAAKMTAKAN